MAKLPRMKHGVQVTDLNPPGNVTTIGIFQIIFSVFQYPKTGMSVRIHAKEVQGEGIKT